jgi:hypothetical protein
MLLILQIKKPDEFYGASYASKILGLSIATIQAHVEKTDLRLENTGGPSSYFYEFGP